MATQSIIVPLRAEGPDGLIGDALVELNPGDDGYDEWRAWFDAHPEDEARYREAASNE